MYFDTGQRTELRQIARIDLMPRTPQFREDQFRDLFREEPVRPATPGGSTQGDCTARRTRPATRAIRAKTPVQVVFDDIRQRLSLLPTGLDAGSQRVSPDGKTLLIIGRAAGQQNLYTFSIDELSREPAVARQLTSTAGAKSDAEFTPDGKEVFLLEQGRITVITVENRNSRRLAVSAEMDVDFAGEKMQVFQQAWSYLRDNFFDPRFNGVDWPAVRARYAPLVAGAATRDEMRRLLNLMVGELNASHLGVNAPAGGGPVVGKLGLRFDRREYEQNGRFKVTEVIPLTPAADCRRACRRISARRQRHGAGRAGQSRTGAEPHHQPPRRSRCRRRCGRRGTGGRSPCGPRTRRPRRTWPTGSGWRRTAPT